MGLKPGNVRFMDERGQKVRWRGRHARRRFIEAFSEGFSMPSWVSNIEIADGPHDGGNHIALAACATGEQTIKVLDRPYSRALFEQQFPGHGHVIIVVEPDDSPRDIRQRTFAALRER